MNQNPLTTANMQGSRVDKTNAGTCYQQNLLNENGEREQYSLLQFYKTVIGHQEWKQMCQMFADILFEIIAMRVGSFSSWQFTIINQP